MRFKRETEGIQYKIGSGQSRTPIIWVRFYKNYAGTKSRFLDGSPTSSKKFCSPEDIEKRNSETKTNEKK